MSTMAPAAAEPAHPGLQHAKRKAVATTASTQSPPAPILGADPAALRDAPPTNAGPSDDRGFSDLLQMEN